MTHFGTNVSIMRRLSGTLAFLLVGALALSGCSGDDGSAASADEPRADDTDGGLLSDVDPPASIDTSGLPSEAELRPGLLTAGQLGFGFDKAPPSDSDSDFCDAEFAEALGFALDELPTAEVAYTEDPDLGPILSEAIGFVPSGTAPQIIPGVREALTQCSGGEIDGYPITLAERPFPTLGDDSVAFDVEMQRPETDVTVNALVVYAMRGDLLTEVAAYDEVESEVVRLVEEYAPKAVDKAAATLVDRLPTPTPLTSRWPAAEPGSGDLGYGLLTAEDVPAPWFDQWNVPRFESLAGRCVARISAATRGMAQIDTALGVSEDGPLVGEVLGRVGGHGPELMATIRQVMSECDGTLLSGRPITVTEVPPIEAGAKTAQAYLLRVNTSPTETLEIGVAYLLTRDLVIRLHTVHVNGDPTALLREYAPVAVDRAADART